MMMDRRAFLASLGVLAVPLAGEAQQAGKVPKIGFLQPVPSLPGRVEAFRQGLGLSATSRAETSSSSFASRASRRSRLLSSQS